MFEKVLIANRGEIAVRVASACRALGIRSAAIYSEADADALHTRSADEAHLCGPARATESYLDVAGIVAIAKRAGADAVHPGYGFLSENAAFAEAVEAAGITFIGPSPEVIRTMGGKIAARERMRAAGVPVVPGSGRITTAAEARSAAQEIGYPVLVKASAGGGGRGMRRVDDAAALEAALERAGSEAEAAFGDGAIYLEKCLIGPRHIEIQIMADSHGRVVHLGERECSIQRRHQKLVEEAPAHGMSEALRREMGEAAVRAAQAVDYCGAGTCEFLVDATGAFYFLEMNTRIQVEHPVTESVTGIDLVVTQIRVASGEALPFAQSDITLQGHAIEVRIYAEDPDKGFIPSPGPILDWRAPDGPGVRLDAGFEAGQTVTPHYDPMIAKLIVSGADRSQALERLRAALSDYWIAGIRTGLPFLRRVASHPVFGKGAYDTSFIEQHMGAPPVLEDEARRLIFAAVAWRAAREAAGSRFRVALPKQDEIHVELQAQRAVGEGREHVEAEVEGASLSFEISPGPPLPAAAADVTPAVFRLTSGARALRLSLVSRKQGGFDVALRDRVLRVRCEVVA